VAVVDSNYTFIYTDIGAFSKDCNSSAFNETVFWKLLNEQKLNISTSKPTNFFLNDNLFYVLVGDEAFALSNNLL